MQIKENKMKSIFYCTIGVVSACRMLTGTVSGDDWPQWNGPKFEMISRETGWSKDWTAQPPKESWTKEIGTGFSSVSVVGDRLYTMGREGDKDVVYCLNATTGEPIWTHAYECELVAYLHEGGPGSTPTVSDGRVFTFSREGHVFCFDANDGTVIWKLFLPDITEVKHPAWGLTSSAIIVDEKVIFESGRLVALNKNDGKLVWQTEVRPAGYGSPIHFFHDGKSLVATLNNAGLLIVDPADGKEIAFTQWKTNWQTNSTTPIYFDGKFFLSTGYNRGCAVYKFEGDKLTEIFANRELSNHMNNSVVYQGHIYGISGNSNISKNCKLVCLDAATGEAKWTKRGVGCGSLLICDRHLVVLTDDGAMTCGPADATEFKGTGKVEALSGKCWTVPVIANSRIYCRSAKGKLACLQLQPDPTAIENGGTGFQPIDKHFAIPETWKRLSKDEIWVDLDARQVIVGGHICLTAGALEFFACPLHTKEHESVVSTHASAKFVHAALLAVGAKPGSPVSYDPDYKPATGPKVKISVRWMQDGKLVEKPAQQMVRSIKTREPMEHDWLFTGSGTWKNPDTGESVYLADSGELICVSNFGNATLDLPVKSSDDASGLLFEALSENIPDLGTLVLLVLEPDVEPTATAANQAQSPLTPNEKSLAPNESKIK